MWRVVSTALKRDPRKRKETTSNGNSKSLLLSVDDGIHRSLVMFGRFGS